MLLLLFVWQWGKELSLLLVGERGNKVLFGDKSENESRCDDDTIRWIDELRGR